MATYYLGPECPKPFSALTDGESGVVLRKLRRLTFACVDRNSFDTRYGRYFHDLVQRHLDIDVADRICYVGEDDEFVERLSEQNCLKHEVTVCRAGRIYCDPGKHDQPINVMEHGIDEHFVGKVDCYDKIILQDSLLYIRTQQRTLANITASLRSNGKVLIVHRAQDTNTLPVFSQAKLNMIEHDKSHVDIIQDLKKCGMNVTWNMEFVPCTMTKLEWLTKISYKQPAHLNLCSMYQVKEGLRNLVEGIFKYEDGVLEFKDQLVFIEATHCSQVQPVSLEIEKKSDSDAERLSLRYELLITPEIHQYIRYMNIPKLPKS